MTCHIRTMLQIDRCVIATSEQLGENPWLQHYSVALLMLSIEFDFLNPTILLIKIIDLIEYCCQGIHFFDNDAFICF